MSEPDPIRDFEFISSYKYMDRLGIEQFEEGFLAINNVCLDQYVHFAVSPNQNDRGELICDYVLEGTRANLDLVAVTNNNTVWRIQDLQFLDGFSDGRFRYGFSIVDN